jgi:hypothetical protein
VAKAEQAIARFEVRKGDGGLIIWDAHLGQRHEQPDLPDSHWWPAGARTQAQTWVDRQQPARTG